MFSMLSPARIPFKPPLRTKPEPRQPELSATSCRAYTRPWVAPSYPTPTATFSFKTGIGSAIRPSTPKVYLYIKIYIFTYSSIIRLKIERTYQRGELSVPSALIRGDATYRDPHNSLDTRNIFYVRWRSRVSIPVPRACKARVTIIHTKK